MGTDSRAGFDPWPRSVPLPCWAGVDTLSPSRRICRTTILYVQSGGRRGFVLRSECWTLSVRPNEEWRISSVADLWRNALLVCFGVGAMVTAHHGGRVFSRPATGRPNETAHRFAGCSNTSQQLGVYCCVGVCLLSLIIYPTWPLVWLSQIGQFQRFSPVATAVGPLLLFALFRWRDKDAQLFLLACLFPQRLYYDAFVLWLIPKTRKEILFTALLSWGAGIWNVLHPEMTSVGIVSALFFFLPMLAVILLRPSKKAASLRRRRSTVGRGPRTE